ncbi:hypothetical protein K7432_013595 [Basidiobolus ranarum]|uniref:Uncharacterized protein n=1 Tax=Basidiobolus ranarum TaxID=34480 RepID=A0ABR2WIZ8_9FUNG
MSYFNGGQYLLVLFSLLFLTQVYATRYNFQMVKRPITNRAQPINCPANLPAEGFLKEAGCTTIRTLEYGLFSPCCDMKEACYARCGVTKFECENQFRMCMRGFCPQMTQNPPKVCNTVWGFPSGSGFADMNLDRAEDFSCDAFLKAQLNAKCSGVHLGSPMMANPYIY